MKEIPLNHGYVAQVDDDDYDALMCFTWHAKPVPKSKQIYPCHATFRVNGHQFQIRMHQLLMGFPKGKEVDHVDGNGLNNQRSNLRICTHAQNMANQRLKTNNTSGSKGVHWGANVKKWRARIGVGYKRIDLGCFDNIADAEKAYSDAARRYYGQFARTR